jgi:hypothetical protein
MCDTGVQFTFISSGGSGGGPSLQTSVNITSKSGALTAVQNFVSSANTTFKSNTAVGIRVSDPNVGGDALTYSWTITNFFTAFATPWKAPASDGSDDSTHNQPFLLLESYSETGTVNRFYLLWWDLEHDSSDPFITTNPIWKDDAAHDGKPWLPGWADAHGLLGFDTLWKGSADFATWQNQPDHPEDSDAWGDVACWFGTLPDGTAIPGQLTLVNYTPPTPDPTPTAVTGAGPGEIDFNGEQIALLLPGFNDYLAKIWRPVAHAQTLTLYAKPLAGWAPTPDELVKWKANCKSAPIVVEFELKN